MSTHAPEQMPADRPLLEVRDLVKTFPGRRGLSLTAVAGVSLTVPRHKTLGVVGESGCGKSTTLRCAVRLLEPTSGSILFDGEDMTHMRREPLRQRRRHFQTVFQDPQASLNPRMRVAELLEEPLLVHGRSRKEAADRAREVLQLVQLPEQALDRFPHEFSGGQRQRVAIARALALAPSLVALDEPVSALDVSIQADIMQLLLRLRDELGLSYLFVAHDLAVVRHVSDEVAVMYLGKVVESGEKRAIYRRPMHPYTQALLSAAPVPDPRAQRRPGTVVPSGDAPDPSNPPSGCRFRTRCPLAADICSEQEPPLVELAPGQQVACHFPRPLDVLAPSAADARLQTR